MQKLKITVEIDLLPNDMFEDDVVSSGEDMGSVIEETLEEVIEDELSWRDFHQRSEPGIKVYTISTHVEGTDDD